jgi:hypothetical protein
MNNLIKKNITMIALSLFSVSSFSTTTDLHNMSTAISSYSDFKSGVGDDPLSIVNSSYKERYFNEISTEVDSQKEVIISTFIESNDYSIAYKLKEFSSSESDELSSIYTSNFDEDGVFNPEAYSDSYESFMASKRLSREIALDSYYDGMADAINEGYDLSNEYESSIKEDIYTAQNNLISLITTDASDRKSNLNNILTNASERLADYSPLALETQTAAYQFADCGTACEIEDPPSVDPVDPPSTTGTWVFQSGDTTSDCDSSCTMAFLSANPSSEPSGTCDNIGDVSYWSTVISVDVRAQDSTVYTSEYECI